MFSAGIEVYMKIIEGALRMVRGSSEEGQMP
jgi:hypothetical protein